MSVGALGCVAMVWGSRCAPRRVGGWLAMGFLLAVV